MSGTLHLVDCLLTSARNLQRLGRPREAEKVLHRLVRLPLTPEHAAAVHSLLAEVRVNDEDFRQARRHLTAALTARPERADYHFRMALAIEADPDARPERARGHYLRALQLEPKNAGYWLDFAFYLLTLEDQKRGLRALRRAYALGSNDPEIVGRVAEGLRQEGLAGEARSKLIAALFNHPRDRRFRTLWQEHQFEMLYQQQERERRERTAAVISMPVLLPFTATEGDGRFTVLGGKTLRLDPARPLGRPKGGQRQSQRRPV